MALLIYFDFLTYFHLFQCLLYIYSDLMKIPLVGCASHRLNLAVKKYFSTDQELLEKVCDLMKKMKTLKVAGQLRKIRNCVL